jgi:LuxR family maltose regulon positive regulatory protein
LDNLETWLEIAEAHYLRYRERAEHEPENKEGLLWNYRTGYGQTVAIRATLAMLRHDTAEAIAQIQRALTLLPPSGLVLMSVMSLNLGQVHLAQGDASSAVTALEKAIEVSRKAKHNYIYINALTLLAEAHQKLGDLHKAKNFYQQAVQFAESHHISHLGKSAAQALAALPDQNPPALPSPLNTRELEILRLLASGMSNQAIASQLVIAVSTVRWHIKHLYHKLGVHNRTQAAYQARALGLL